MIEAVVSFVVVVLLHAVATRLPPARQTVPKLVLVGGIVGLGLAGWLLSQYGLSIVTVAGLLLYALLCELYVFCFTLTMNSVSVRLLILLRNNPSRIDTLVSHADRDSLVARRVETMIANGFLEQGPDGLRLTAKGQKTLTTFERLRGCFRPISGLSDASAVQVRRTGPSPLEPQPGSPPTPRS